MTEDVYRALEKSIAMINVRCGRQGSLKPLAILRARGRRVETVWGWNESHVWLPNMTTCELITN